AKLRYSDPVRGGDVMPTMRCEVERVTSGTSTAAFRQTGGKVACVLHGTGRARVGEREFDLAPGDIVAVPSWSRYQLVAHNQLDVFSVSDAPMLEALGLFRTSEA